MTKAGSGAGIAAGAAAFVSFFSGEEGPGGIAVAVLLVLFTIVFFVLCIFGIYRRQLRKRRRRASGEDERGKGQKRSNKVRDSSEELHDIEKEGASPTSSLQRRPPVNPLRRGFSDTQWRDLEMKAQMLVQQNPAVVQGLLAFGDQEGRGKVFHAPPPDFQEKTFEQIMEEEEAEDDALNHLTFMNTLANTRPRNDHANGGGGRGKEKGATHSNGRYEVDPMSLQSVDAVDGQAGIFSQGLSTSHHSLKEDPSAEGKKLSPVNSHKANAHVVPMTPQQQQRGIDERPHTPDGAEGVLPVAPVVEGPASYLGELETASILPSAPPLGTFSRGPVMRPAPTAPSITSSMDADIVQKPSSASKKKERATRNQLRRAATAGDLSYPNRWAAGKREQPITVASLLESFRVKSMMSQPSTDDEEGEDGGKGVDSLGSPPLNEAGIRTVLNSFERRISPQQIEAVMRLFQTDRVTYDVFAANVTTISQLLLFNRMFATLHTAITSSEVMVKQRKGGSSKRQVIDRRTFREIADKSSMRVTAADAIFITADEDQDGLASWQDFVMNSDDIAAQFKLDTLHDSCSGFPAYLGLPKAGRQHS
eukprot:CAMPEP_0113880278 /NCGR_PEP_ID=MMETSP0780_2-20120614/7696_1 /TAXON_ID=652834 /ORGANISM="Palpitomonas bilix" /LENGTH=591 /DNA_ID=CAMNT_0000866935 /DNA_START=338 /DNA_END=2113 /DNA_ORIENTATION=+ /assembly_acc=CAM_ASM_000599